MIIPDRDWAAEVLERTRPLMRVGHAHRVQGTLCLRQGRYREAEEHLGLAAAKARTLRDLDGERQSLSHLAEVRLTRSPT